MAQEEERQSPSAETSTDPQDGSAELRAILAHRYNRLHDPMRPL